MIWISDFVSYLIISVTDATLVTLVVNTIRVFSLQLKGYVYLIFFIVFKSIVIYPLVTSVVKK